MLMRRKSLLFVLVLFAGLALAAGICPTGDNCQTNPTQCACDALRPICDPGHAEANIRGCRADTGDCLAGMNCMDNPALCPCNDPMRPRCVGVGQQGADGRGCAADEPAGCGDPKLTDCPIVGCVDLQWDQVNCGECGKICTDWQKCESGDCLPLPCADDWMTRCDDGVCYDLDKDHQRCGSCTKACTAEQECSNGVCMVFECTDGTPTGTCTSTPPKYCDKDGNLVVDETNCPCHEGYQVEGDTCVEEAKKCTDGTPYSTCTANPPLYCASSGNIVVNEENCPCPEGYKVSGDKCVEDVKECSDGTPYDTCTANPPLYCASSGNIVVNEANCPCPEGYEVSGDQCVKETTEGTGTGTGGEAAACDMDRHCEATAGENCGNCADCYCSDADPCTLEECSGGICTYPADASKYGQQVTISRTPAICCTTGHVKYGECCDDNQCDDGYECIDNKCESIPGATTPLPECKDTGQCTKAPYGTCTNAWCSDSGTCEYDIDCNACGTGTASWCGYCVGEGYCCVPEDCPKDGKTYECASNKCREKTVAQVTSKPITEGQVTTTPKPEPIEVTKGPEPPTVTETPVVTDEPPSDVTYEDKVTLVLNEPFELCGYKLNLFDIDTLGTASVEVVSLDGSTDTFSANYIEALLDEKEIMGSYDDLTVIVNSDTWASGDTAEVVLILEGDCPGEPTETPDDPGSEGEPTLTIFCRELSVRGGGAVSVPCRFEVEGYIPGVDVDVGTEEGISSEPSSFWLDEFPWYDDEEQEETGVRTMDLVISADHTCEERSTSVSLEGTYSLAGEERSAHGGAAMTILPAEDCFKCGDAQCEMGENYRTCCNDCPCPENYNCQDNSCILQVKLSEPGDSCSTNEGCTTGNCQNGVCCAGGEKCCESDAHCGRTEMCDTGRFYCIPAEPPPGPTGGKPDGAPCFKPDECGSGNCQNTRCCEAGRGCCAFDDQCGDNEMCDRGPALCVPVEVNEEDKEQMQQEMLQLQTEVAETSQSFGELSDAMYQESEEKKEVIQKLGAEERNQRMIERIDKLLNELKELEVELDANPGKALKAKNKLEKAMERAKDKVAVDVNPMHGIEEREAEVHEERIDHVLAQALTPTDDAPPPSEKVESVRESAKRLRETVKQRVKAEVIEATYQSGAKRMRTVVTRTIENTASETVDGAVLIMEIPKSAAVSALELHYTCQRTSGQPCPVPRVLRDDPLVGWDLSALEPGESVTTSYTAEGEIGEAEVQASTAVVATDVNLDAYRSVDEEREALQSEEIQMELQAAIEEAGGIEDEGMRQRIEELTMETQASLEAEDLVDAHTAVARIKTELDAAKQPPPGEEQPIDKPGPTAGPKDDKDEGLLFGILPTDKDGLVKFFKEYWEIVAAFIGSLSIIAYYLKVLKRKTIGEEAVVIRRGKTMEGNAVKLGIKVKNDSTFKITEVKVTIDYPKAFKVQGGSPTVELGNIRPDEFQSAIFHLVPTRCVKGTVTGYATYENNKGETKVVQIDPVDVGSVCPFLERVRLTPQEFAQRKQYLQSGTKSMSLRTDPTRIFQVVKTRFNNIHTVHEEVAPDRTSMLGEYSGQGAYSKAFIGASIKVVYGAQGQVELSVYGEDEAMVTGLLSELVDLIEKEEGGGQPV